MAKLDRVHLKNEELLQYSWQQSSVGIDSPLSKQSYKSQAFQTLACIILILINERPNQHFFNSFDNTWGTKAMYFCICHDSNTTSNGTILQAYFIYFLTQFETSLHNEIPRAPEFLFSAIPTPTYLQYFKRQGEGCVMKCYFCLVFKNSNHEIQKPRQQQLQPQCPFSFTCFWGK